MVSKQSGSGFTLLEVTIVLALAGVILSVIFLGVNQALIARRDQARKDGVNRFIAALIQQSSSDGGVFPVCGPDNAHSCPVPESWVQPEGIILGAGYFVGGHDYIEWGSVSNPSPTKNCNATATTIGYVLIRLEQDNSYYCRTY